MTNLLQVRLVGSLLKKQLGDGQVRLQELSGQTFDRLLGCVSGRVKIATDRAQIAEAVLAHLEDK